MDLPQIEKKILRFWGKNKIFEKLRKKIKGKERWSFLDGPITANNPMGVHHAWGRTYKDLFQRYNAMKGFDQRFQNGFDCQGLWVEVEVEKQLGFKTKKDIEKFGIAEFVEKCKERVWKYSKIQTEQSIRLGQWMDWENSYYTMSDENNYAIWHFLKKCWQDKLLYKGRDVVPWCPRCVDGSSKILLSNGLSKSIKELKNCWKHHKVVGFAERENKMTVAPVRDYITIPKESIFRLSTVETDRSISVTADHPFWVKGKGWIPLDKINIGEKVAVYPHPEIFEDKSIDKKILDEEDLKNIITDFELKRGKKKISSKFSHYRDLVTIDKWELDKKIRSFRAQNCTLREIQKRILLEYKVKISFNAICQVNNVKKKNRTLEYVIRELKVRDLLPLTTKNPKLLIISRLLGHVFGDGFLSLSSGKRINFGVGLTGRKKDLNEIKKDLDELGFSYGSINKRFITSNLRDRVIRGYSTEFRAGSPTLAVLLAVLGAPVGKKSRTHFEVPKWLFGAPKHIVREFLSAYFGSELTKIKIHRKKFDALQFSLNKNEKLVKNGHNFVRQISKLLKKFNVKIQNIRFRPILTRKDGSKSVRISAIFSASKENLLNFCKFIGYRYSKERENIARSVQEYLELKEKLKEKKMNQYERIFKLKERGLTIVKISKTLHLPKRKVEEILRTKSLSNIKVNNPLIFSKWLKEATDGLKNPFVWGTVKEIKKVGVKDVFDISVNPLHSFVANGFITHNCGTAISQHEILTEEYREISHKAIFVKLPVIGEKDTFFLVWTTTPWTLPANAALAVHPNLKYSKIRDRDNNTYILLKDKASLVKNGKIIDTFEGKKLEGAQYDGLFDELGATKEAMKNRKHKVILWNEVNPDEGTGIVHIAPGCGQEDFQLGKKFDLPTIDPLDDESGYKEGFDDFTGKLATEVNDSIFENLKQKGLVFKIEDYLHRYPTCWRCKSELIFRLVDEWYISMDKLRKPLMAVAKKIKWIPSFGLERELDWLKNMQDWLISKKRYWGLALPIFECECGNFEVIGSKEELKERAVEGWKEFEDNTPHRPWVDRIKIKCSKCNRKVSRVLDVGNPWLDAGIVSFSTMKYFSDKEYWRLWFPVDFICESFPGQFKNWFYSLIVMSTVLGNTNPTKTIFGFALVRDEKGEEMHKSKGNAIEFNEAAEKIGADVMRWMYVKQNPAFNLNFGWKAGEESKRKLLTLWNSFIFLQTYSGKKDLSRKTSLPKTNHVLDKWIMSRLNNLIEKVSGRLDRYNAAPAALAIENFFIEDLSLWYVRRSRRRFHPVAEQSTLRGKKARKDSEKAVHTLYYVILNLIKIMAPLLPFLTEEIYQGLKTKGMPESIHLFDWPKTDKKLVNQKLEEKMRKIREITAMVLAKRAGSGIKVRQPLARLKIKDLRFKLEKELLELIKEEVNVKEIIFDSKIKSEVELDTKITPKLKEEGIIREVIRQIQEMRKKAGLKPKDKISIRYLGESKLNEILSRNKKIILKETQAKDFCFGQGIAKIEKEIKTDAMKLRLGIIC